MVSPYLQKPLRTLEQATRDLAGGNLADRDLAAARFGRGEPAAAGMVPLSAEKAPPQGAAIAAPQAELQGKRGLRAA